MHAEQVLESQFNMGITCNQVMHAEQALKSQFNMDLNCSQVWLLSAAKTCMLNRL